MDRSGFAILYVDKLEALIPRYRGEPFEDEMVGLYPLCAFGQSSVPASIDTPLHAFLPFDHVDHLHPDWAIALAASANGARKLLEFNDRFGRHVAWIPWQRPGFELALMLRRAVDANQVCDGILLGGHGLFTWGDTQQSCYLNSLKTIDQMGEFIEEHARRTDRPAFGGAAITSAVEPEATAAQILPSLRGVVSSNRRTIAHWDHSGDALAFANSRWARELCSLGTSCPDHFLRTRISPMFVPWDPSKEDPATLVQRIRERAVTYREDYAVYYRSCAGPDSPALRDSNPSVVVIPGLGIFGFARDKREARITTEFFINAIHVMSGANALDDPGAPAVTTVPQAKRPDQAKEFASFRNYVALPRPEAFRIEYWALEEAKLKRMPAEREFSRKIAVIVGGGSGIGREVALDLAKRGAHVVVADQNAESAHATWSEAKTAASDEAGLACAVDLASRDSIAAALRAADIGVRRRRHRHQHGGDLSDRGPVGIGVGQNAGDQRHQQPRPRTGCGQDPERARPAGIDRDDELGQRGRVQGRQRALRREQGRDQPFDSRAGDRAGTARARQRHRPGHRRRWFRDVSTRSGDRIPAEIQHRL